MYNYDILLWINKDIRQKTLTFTLYYMLKRLDNLNQFLMVAVVCFFLYFIKWGNE